jgi:hypothetical protein
MFQVQCKGNSSPRKPPIKSPTPLLTFTIFLLLPTELRLKIWQYAALQPQEIKLFILSPEWMSPRMKQQTRAPAIMHTCHESREEGKRFYIPCHEKFSPIGPFPSEIWTNVPQRKTTVWINFSLDRFVYDSGHEASFRQYSKSGFNFHASALNHIQHLGLFNTRESSLWSGLHEVCSLLRKGEVRSFTLMQKHFGCGEEGVNWEVVQRRTEQRLLGDSGRHKWRYGWKVPMSFEWRGGEEVKSQPRLSGVAELPRSENPSVVTVDGEMIWQLDEEVRL